MNFDKWIGKKYDQWMISQDRKERSIELFAKEVGVSQQLMSFWLNGHRKPGIGSVYKLMKKFSNDVYEIDDVPLPPRESSFDSFPPQIREIFERSRDEINSIYARENVPADSPEALRIAEEVLSKYGIIINSVEQLDDE